MLKRNKIETFGKMPKERNLHTSFVWKDSIYIYGGNDETIHETIFGSLYKLNIFKREWEEIISDNDIRKRYYIFNKKDGSFFCII
jgi:hypothetical protein